MPLIKKKTSEIEIVSDRYSVEIFVDGKSLSSAVYSEPEADGLHLEIDCDGVTYRRYDVAEK